MLSNQKLFTVGTFDFRLQHLLVIGVLALSVSISMLIRSTPATYGLELFEFDPFFNFRATEYVLENGYDAYFQWIDEKSWHPFGRDISENSQVSLHISASIFYQLFGSNSSLYDFVIIFPLVIGSLTAISVFAFVRVLGGTTAGLLAALMFSVSAPIFTRGLIGWFKSEPLGLFFAFLAMYLFVSGIMFNKGKFSFIKLVFAGIFLALGLSSWGGILFFLIPIVLFYLILPFLKREKNFTIWAAPVFSVSLILSLLLFERTSTFTIGYAGLLVGLSTVFVVVCELIKKFSNESKHIRNCSIFLTSIIIAMIGVFASGIVGLPGFRYLNAMNPFLTSLDPLTDSVSEHMTTSITTSYTFVSVFIIFGIIGIWFLFSRKTIDLKIDKRIFALIIGIAAIYISSSFVRLELFASVGLIILGSIGLAILFKKILESNIFSSTKILFCGVILGLFLTPVILPEDLSWSSWAEFPPTILHGGSFFQISTNDWPDAMNWLKNNTSEDAIIASWWDYGYWITTLSNRTTIVDNATVIDWQIKKMAYSLITTPENSWQILNSHYTEDVSKYLGDDNVEEWGGETYQSWLSSDDARKDCKPISISDAKKLDTIQKRCFPVAYGLDADYLLIYVAGERIPIPGSNLFFYTLDGGGDESKKHWFMKISNHEPSKFLEYDGITPTSYFMENSTLGKLMPFSIFKHVDPDTSRAYDEHRDGLIPIYIKDIKYMDSENDPFYLVYASPSFYSEIPGPMSTVLIYKINPNYIP
ncbi:glycosyltransferase family 39 protein [Candidatus Nitrosopelagicus sp.]|nr:glycosyltransferase family 39 protein [Candidatus Nitrosopelagicus sp.]